MRQIETHLSKQFSKDATSSNPEHLDIEYKAYDNKTNFLRTNYNFQIQNFVQYTRLTYSGDAFNRGFIPNFSKNNPLKASDYDAQGNLSFNINYEYTYNTYGLPVRSKASLMYNPLQSSFTVLFNTQYNYHCSN